MGEVKTEDKKWCVYMHTNKINGKKYIGQTCQNPPVLRWGNNGSGYLRQNSDGTYSQEAMATAVLDYPDWKNDWEHQIINDNLTQEEANALEIKLIAKYKTNCRKYNNPSFGYNMTDGGSDVSGENNPFYGKKHTDDTREKISKNHADISGENNPMFGKCHSEETKAKIRERHVGREPWNKGKKMTQEYCLKNSESHKGKQIGEQNPFYNKHHTEESKEKMSQSKKGKYSGINNPMYGSGEVVLQISIDNQIIGEYISGCDAHKATGVSLAGIYNCCNDKQETSGGFKWKRKKDWEEMQGAI